MPVPTHTVTQVIAGPPYVTIGGNRRSGPRLNLKHTGRPRAAGETTPVARACLAILASTLAVLTCLASGIQHGGVECPLPAVTGLGANHQSRGGQLAGLTMRT